MRQASKGQQGWGIFRPGIHGSTPPGRGCSNAGRNLRLVGGLPTATGQAGVWQGVARHARPRRGGDTGCLMPLTEAGLACLTRSCEGLLVGLYRGKDQGY